MTALSLVIGIGVLGLLWRWFSRWTDRLSREKLEAMQSAFAFLERDFGMRCVRRRDEGMGAEVRFEDDEVAVSIWYDRGYYSATLELVADARYRFDIDELRPTMPDRSEGKTVAALGSRIRPDFVSLRADLRSERADAIVRDRARKVAEGNRRGEPKRTGVRDFIEYVVGMPAETLQVGPLPPEMLPAVAFRFQGARAGVRMKFLDSEGRGADPPAGRPVELRFLVPTG